MAGWTRLTLAALMFCSLPACVYYNTFYNARKQFSDAHSQRLASEAEPDNRILANAYRDYYLSAIKKASAVLDLYPDSKWIDDSLLLIGKSYYWRGEHKEAILKYDEILENFPDSELVTEAQYWKAIALWGNETITLSRELLEQISGSDDRIYAGQARLALAELEHSQESYDRAVKAYLSLVGTLTDRELETRLWKGLGDTYYAQGSLENALNAYAKVLETGPDPVISYQTQLQIGASQELMGNLDAALITYRRLERTKRFRLYQPKIQVRMANVYRLTGDIEGALGAYQEIIKQNSRTETSAEAYYQIAMIEHQVRKDNKVALELFAKARKERSSSEAAVRAREMETTLFQLDRFRKRADKETKQGNEALFSVAEIYLFSLGEVDSALSTYKRVLAREDSLNTPKALYGIGMIYADSLDKKEEADRIFQTLVDEYPVTPYAVDARRRIGQDRSDDVLAEARYVEAEALKAEGADPVDVVRILQQVTEEYPNSLYAPKALFALGWAYENDIGDLDAATRNYRLLIDTYPMTDFADVSEDKVKQIARELREAKREKDRAEREAKKAETKEETPTKQASKDPQSPSGNLGSPDSSTATPVHKEIDAAREDTPPTQTDMKQTEGPLEAGQIEQLPSIVSAPAPRPREELEEEDIDPNVMVRILVGKNGRVKRVVVVEGAEVLHEAAVDAAFEYIFTPGKHEDQPREVWMEFPITFISPEQATGDEGEPQ